MYGFFLFFFKTLKKYITKKLHKNLLKLVKKENLFDDVLSIISDDAF